MAPQSLWGRPARRRIGRPYPNPGQAARTMTDVRRLLVMMVFVLVVAACSDSGGSEAEVGAGEDTTSTTTSTTGAPAADDAPTTTTAPTTTAAPSTTAPTTTTIAPSESDCPNLGAILGVLWNHWVDGDAATPAFAAFSDEPPAGQMTITAFDAEANLLAAIWDFPDPQGDGLARGIVWSDGEILGEIYYLDGVDPLSEGATELLDTDDILTLELTIGDDGYVTADCWAGPRPALIPIDTPLTIYGLGPIEPGMTLAEVVAVLPPFDVVPIGFEEFGGACFHVAIGATGVNLQLEGLGPDSSALDGIVRVVSVNWAYQTPSGLGFGSTKAEVEAALGDQLEVSPHAYVEGFYLDFVPNDPAEQDLRLRFVITSDIVTEMRAGYADWTSLVEGCA